MSAGHFHGKVAVITGASSGIGAETARLLADEGYRLVLTARRRDRLDAVANEIREKRPGLEIAVVAVDLSDLESIDRVISTAVDRFGGIDVLINNAGFGLADPFSESDPEAIERQIVVNFTAPVLLTRRALPHLIASKGTIINVGSSITAIANPVMGVYGATKAALAYWNDALRRELMLKEVTVCLVEPGPVETDFFDAACEQSGKPVVRNPLTNPPPGLAAPVRKVAARIARLLVAPRRRVSPDERVTTAFRAIGLVFRIAPSLGDRAVSTVMKRANDYKQKQQNSSSSETVVAAVGSDSSGREN